MSRQIHYEKELRTEAEKTGMGLVTIEIIDPGKKLGRLGMGMALQGMIDAKDAKILHTFLLRYINRCKVKP